MSKVSNVLTARFYEKIRAICGSCVLIDPNLLSPEMVRQGRHLVKTALYHIRRGLATGARSNVNFADYQIMRYFAGREHVDEILNLMGFEALWNATGDRGLLIDIMEVLRAYVQPEDMPRLLQFRQKLEQSRYEGENSDEVIDDEDEETYAQQAARWHSLDRQDFQKVLTAAGATL